LEQQLPIACLPGNIRLTKGDVACPLSGRAQQPCLAPPLAVEDVIERLTPATRKVKADALSMAAHDAH
jgi:hypothetical protein